MNGKFKRTCSSVAWRTNAKFKRTYSSVAWRMNAKFKRTCNSSHRVACPSSASLHERSYMPHPTPPMNTCTCRQPQSSMSFISKFTWTLVHAPPHPTPLHPTPPQPTPPMSTKHHGLLKAVVQLVIATSKMQTVFSWSTMKSVDEKSIARRPFFPRQKLVLKKNNPTKYYCS